MMNHHSFSFISISFFQYIFFVRYFFDLSFSVSPLVFYKFTLLPFFFYSIRFFICLTHTSLSYSLYYFTSLFFSFSLFSSFNTISPQSSPFSSTHLKQKYLQYLVIKQHPTVYSSDFSFVEKKKKRKK